MAEARDVYNVVHTADDGSEYSKQDFFKGIQLASVDPRVLESSKQRDQGVGPLRFAHGVEGLRLSTWHGPNDHNVPDSDKPRC